MVLGCDRRSTSGDHICDRERRRKHNPHPWLSVMGPAKPRLHLDSLGCDQRKILHTARSSSAKKWRTDSTARRMIVCGQRGIGPGRTPRNAQNREFLRTDGRQNRGAAKRQQAKERSARKTLCTPTSARLVVTGAYQSRSSGGGEGAGVSFEREPPWPKRRSGTERRPRTFGVWTAPRIRSARSTEEELSAIAL